MHALFAGLTTLDVIHALDHEPDLERKTTSTHHTMAAGGPATNAAVTFATLESFRPQHTHTPPSAITLLSALGEGTIARSIAADLAHCQIRVCDASDPNSQVREPAISSIIEHPGGRMVASTNARILTHTAWGSRLLEDALACAGSPDVILIDGHNPELAALVLQLGLAPEPGPEDDPFARLDARPSYQRILDGGSWKAWLPTLLPFVDIAIVSADFCPPLLPSAEGEAVADFLRGFGITRTIQTHGPEAIQWWWEDQSGTCEVEKVEAVSTLGAGDIFHGAFAWAIALLHEGAQPLPDTPEEIIRFASRIAGISTTHFGTRSWREDLKVKKEVETFLSKLSSR